jgi:hypothetical protein
VIGEISGENKNIRIAESKNVRSRRLSSSSRSRNVTVCLLSDLLQSIMPPLLCDGP